METQAEPTGGEAEPESTSRYVSRSIEGKVAVVTGAASGMGRAIGELFAAEGAQVAPLDRDAPSPFTLDVTDPDAIRAVMTEVKERLGPVDILVNCAGVSVAAPIGADDYEDAWNATMAVNLLGYVRMIRACLRDLERQPGGRIVNIASTEGLGATPYLSPYTVSKHGVIGLTRSLAVELGALGITVNCICPGPIHTGMTAVIPDDAKATFARRRVPLRRYGEPDEVAHVVLSLALPASSFVNGAVVTVDGGLSVKFA